MRKRARSRHRRILLGTGVLAIVCALLAFRPWVLETYYLHKLRLEQRDFAKGHLWAMELSAFGSERTVRALASACAETGNLAYIEEPMARMGVKAVRYIVRIVDSKDTPEEVAWYAREALLAIRVDGSSLAALDAVLAARDPVLRRFGCLFLSRKIGERCLARLVKALQTDPEALVRRDAAWAVGELCDPASLEAGALRRACDDPVDDVRTAAREALLVLEGSR